MGVFGRNILCVLILLPVSGRREASRLYKGNVNMWGCYNFVDVLSFFSPNDISVNELFLNITLLSAKAGALNLA